MRRLIAFVAATFALGMMLAAPLAAYAKEKKGTLDDWLTEELTYGPSLRTFFPDIPDQKFKQWRRQRERLEKRRQKAGSGNQADDEYGKDPPGGD